MARVGRGLPKNKAKPRFVKDGTRRKMNGCLQNVYKRLISSSTDGGYDWFVNLSLGRAFLTGVYALVNVAAAHSAESAFWAERRRAGREKHAALLARSTGRGEASLSVRFALPPLRPGPAAPGSPWPHGAPDFSDGPFAVLTPDLGTVQSVSPKTRADRPVVLLVQDLHQNEGAQRNIGKLLHRLTETGRLDWVALEGAAGPVRFDRWRSYPRRDVVLNVADFLLANHRLSGPVHAVLVSTAASSPVDGVDSLSLHAANVDAYRRARDRAPGLRKDLIRQRTAHREGIAQLNPALRRFVHSTQAVEDGTASLGTHARALAALLPVEDLPPAFREFVRVLEMESALDFPGVEAERARVLSELTERLTPSEKEQLLNDSVAFRSGRLPHDRFYGTLRRWLVKKGGTLSPDFDRYVEYVVRAGRISGSDLQRALRRVEKDVRVRWGRTEFEKAWLEEDRRIARDLRLVDFALTPVDWEEHKAVARADDFNPFMDFYRNAEARDHAMAARVIAGVQERRARLTLLVAGGFHGDGLTVALENAGLTVVRFVPRVETVATASGEAALSIFAQEKLPLERIAAGEKLFLAPPPAAGKAEAPFYAAALDPDPAGALNALYEGLVPIKTVRMEGDLIPHLHAEFANGESVNVHVFYDARGKPSFRQRAAGHARDVFWKPLREWPQTVRALFNRAAFFDFLRVHPVVVRGTDPEKVNERAVWIFRQRAMGLTRWLPTGATLGAGFGLGVAGTLLSFWGAEWAARGLLPFLLNLTALATVSVGVGFSAGLTLAHAVYNFAHPEARLALPGDVRISLDPALRARVNDEAGLRAAFTDLAPRLGHLSPRVVLRSRHRSGIQLSRDRSRLVIYLAPDAGRGAGEIHRAISNELGRLERFLADTRGGAVYAIPVRHETKADFPAAVLDALPYPLFFVEEYGSVFPREELLEAFQRSPEVAENLLFAKGEGVAPVDMDSLRWEPDRMRRWVSLWGPQNALTVKMLGERTAALERGDEAGFAAVGAEGDFGRVRRQWLFKNRRRITLVAEPFAPDVDFFIAQSVFLAFASWSLGPWSISPKAKEPALDRAMERALQTFLVLAKATFLRNERLKAHLRQSPLDPDARAVFVVGAAHRLGLQEDLFEWAPAPDGDGYVQRYFEMPSGKLEAELQNHLLASFPNPTAQDLSIFSDWVRRLSVFRPTLSPEGRRWLLEWAFARWLRETRSLLAPGGTKNPPDVDAVEEAIHALYPALPSDRLENWMARATMDFAFQGKAVWVEFAGFLDGPSVPAGAALTLRREFDLSGALPPTLDENTRLAEVGESVAAAVARSVSQWLVAFQNAARQSQAQKEDGSWLSDADVFATRMIVGALLHAFPQHGVVVEEDLASVDPALAERAAANAASPYVWHVDPLDGSESYLRGSVVFAVHIALTFRGDPVVAVVALPRVLGPDGKPLVVSARRNRPGLFVNGRARPPVENALPPLDLSRLSAMAHGKSAVGRFYPHLAAAKEKCREVFERAGSAGYWLTALALRRVGVDVPGVPSDFAVFASDRLKPWDIVAPGALIQAVGGQVEGHDAGDPYFPVTTIDREAPSFVLAGLSPAHARLWRTEVIEDVRAPPPRAGPAPGTVEIVHPERVKDAAVTLCFFDVNGTLWRGYPFDLKATLWARFLHGTPIPLPHQVREIQTVLAETDWMNLEDQERELDRFARERNLPRVDSPRGKNWSENVVRSAVNRAMIERAVPAAVIPGLKAFLEALHKSGVHLEVSTSGNAGTRRRVLEGLAVASLFSRVHGGGHKEAVIANRVAEEKLEGRRVAMVGDGPGDMAAARQNGALAVGIVTGPAHAERLRRAGADVLVYGDYSDTAALLNVLGVGRAASEGDMNTDQIARAALGTWAEGWAGKSPAERRAAFAAAVRDFRERLAEGGFAPEDLRRRRESIVAHEILFNGTTPAEVEALYGDLLSADDGTLPLHMSREGELEKRRALFFKRLAALARTPPSSAIRNPRFAQFEAALDRLVPPGRGGTLREGGLWLLLGMSAPVVAVGVAAVWAVWDLWRHGRSSVLHRWARRAARAFRAPPAGGAPLPLGVPETGIDRAILANIVSRSSDLGVGRPLRFEPLSRGESWAAAGLKPMAGLVGIPRLRLLALMGRSLAGPFAGVHPGGDGDAGRRPVVFVFVSRSMVPRLDGAVERALGSSAQPPAEVVLLPLDSEGREALARKTFAHPRVRALADIPRRSAGSVVWDLGDLESFVADRVDLSRYTDGRLMTTADVVFVAGSARSALFRNALVQLLDLWFPVTMPLRRWDQIQRVFQAIASAA